MKAILTVVFAAIELMVGAAPIKVTDCVRNAEFDYWAAADVKFCHIVLQQLFRDVGVETEHVPFGKDGHVVETNAIVIASAFRTPDLLENYNFPLQPLGRMHYALYATPAHAMSMMSMKISDWPRMRVGYSPVSQGQNQDRQNYFKHANLSPEYVEYPTSKGAVKALLDGEIDALFLYTPFSKRPEGLVEVVPIGERNVYFAVRKDNPELFAKLSKAWRDFYIDHIDLIDKWREEILGFQKPKNRVRVAAYERGDIFEISPDGVMSGALALWMKTICGHTRWTADYVYGSYDESLEDVRNGRLDLIGGLGFTSSRRSSFYYPHTSIGMLRVYLWAHPGSKYKPGQPSTWDGMKVGMLSGAVSSERAKRQFEHDTINVSYVEYLSDTAMIAAYFKGEVDACIDVDMPDLANEVALHLYASHPMYICASLKRTDLFDDLEHALDLVCDDFPKYMRMISEHHYGHRSEMAALTMREAEWLNKRIASGKPITIDFSPWPFPVMDAQGHPMGLIGAFTTELSRKTGLRVVPQAQTGIMTAEAKFMRGETELWIPFPAEAKDATYGAKSVFALPVPQSVAEFYGAKDEYLDFEMFANKHVPPELVSILHKVAMGIDASRAQEMFMGAVAERKVVHKIFGMTHDELLYVIWAVSLFLMFVFAAYGFVMIWLLKKEARRANAAAAVAEEHAHAKTRFLAMMSHELRTPLNAVIGFAEFMSKKDLEEKLRDEYIKGILLSANALLKLINGILDLSKLDVGAMNMRSGVCDMRQLMNELPAIFGYQIRRHGVKLNVEMPKDKAIPLLELTQQGMRQILLNLVGNAAKFTETGAITIRAGWDDATRTLHLEVADTGCGISEEKMKKLFDPFVQDIASRMRAGGSEIKGTGLGLPIVHRMVESAKGTISVKSELGRGTVFTIDIPGLVVLENVPQTPRPAEKLVQTVLPEHILVVDDIMMNRKILGIHLHNMKIKDIRYAENGEEALDMMKEWVPDIVLTDMWMPKMDGSQLAEAMRKDGRLSEIPIVAITADVDVGATYDISLFAKVIAKPVNGEKLRALFGDIASS
ncbi:MAG: response regulator [Kiritimatiellae bacterium]|nr:response regulator [Kiritimatiellia bacterium]